MMPRVLRRVGILVCALPALAAAQVGTTPENSPFRDLEKRQEVALLFGPSIGGRDVAGAAPRGGFAIGARYDLLLGSSPLAFTASLMRQSSSRDVLQPGLPLASRIGRTVSQPLYFIDVAFTMLLTGNRSWHSFTPSVTAGVGLATDNKSFSDSSRFEFGNRFSPVVGFGVKYAPLRARWTVRADLTNRLYSVPFPDTFRDSTPGVPRIVDFNTKSAWTRNTMLTVGVVRGFGRR
jgi:hypothetical protein